MHLSGKALGQLAPPSAQQVAHSSTAAATLALHSAGAASVAQASLCFSVFFSHEKRHDCLATSAAHFWALGCLPISLPTLARMALRPFTAPLAALARAMASNFC